jgi:protein-L-isoaspartate(D-aspartate) O-methyltransferase
MEEYQRLREAMVVTQLIPRGIRDERVLSAMRKVPRHLFMPEPMRYAAYEDRALAIGEGQTISQPYMVAVMTQLLELAGTEKVLEIGTGSGYQAAVLAELAGEVYTVERIPALAVKARQTIESSGYKNVNVIVGDGTLGLEKEASFDRIIVTAGAPSVPLPLIEQLVEGGIIIVPAGDHFSQVLLKGRKSGQTLIEESHTPCAFVPLIGEYGWKEQI